MDLVAYRRDAESFVSAMDREYYHHFSGQKDGFEVEALYGEHAGLFSREAVDGLREAGARELLRFSVEGLIGREVAGETAELARREAALEVEANGERLPFRQASIAQANEVDPERRAALEAARLDLTERELNPLLLAVHERGIEIVGELGWASVAAMCAELSGTDLHGLGAQTTAFLDATEDDFERVVGPELERQTGLGFGELRRSDLPAFFRAPELDGLFPEGRRDAAFRETVAGLGIRLDEMPNVILDTESRPLKTPRAFCAPVRVPDEVYLVIAPTGGRDDYETLLHEAGHTLHYAHVDRALEFEHRYLGDNSVTEGFAFLLQGLASDPAWLRAHLGVEDAATVTGYARASKLVFLRRYGAKLSYELELLGEEGAGPGRYAELLTRAVHVDWPAATWLADVDAFFYAARYLRAWAFETHLRALLRERFGPEWFDSPEAGALLVELWREGQRRDADELLAGLTGATLDFSAMLAEYGLMG